LLNGARKVRLVFADQGKFHEVLASVPAAALEEYERLVDLLREEPAVTRQLYIDMRRLVSATVVEEEGGA
jgi:hypothetical protein